VRIAATLTLVILAAAGPLSPAAMGSPFATRVVAFDPAPGQFVRVAGYSDPAKALGAPGPNGGTIFADNSKVVSLGGLGGSITLGFDRPVWRNRFNPRGCDFIVYGNAIFAGGDPLRRFAECGIIEVSRDDNGNALADDAWYLVPGSHLAAGSARVSVSSDASTLNPLWVPPGRTGVWVVQAYQLTSPDVATHVLVNAGASGVGGVGDAEQVFGYADLVPTMVLGDSDGDGVADDPDQLPTPEAFYTRPDDPLLVGVSPGSGGGSAVRIAWAVNPLGGVAANLDRIDFVRITSGVGTISAVLGEVSTEVSGVADVGPEYTPDWDQNGVKDVRDIFAFLSDWFARVGENGGADFDGSAATGVGDIFAFLAAWFAGP